jgi:drug/metabolite transporter (DMT)-like permease
LLGLALAALTALAFAANGIVSARFTHRVDAILAGFLAHIAGTVAIVVIAAFSGDLDLALSVKPEYFLFLTLAGLVHFALGRALFFLSLRSIGVSRTQIIVQSNPLISIFGALVLFQEPLAPRTLLGLGCLTAGILLVMAE